jgi:hypothetical protein
MKRTGYPGVGSRSRILGKFLETTVNAFIAMPFLFLATGSGPEVDAAQFGQIIKERTASLKTVVFVYEGKTHWIGPSKTGMTAEQFDNDFQGTYLYRADGAALLDVYVKKSNPTAGVIRRKIALIGGKTEKIRALLDAKTPIDPSRDIKIGKGSYSSLNDGSGPHELFWLWYWSERGDLAQLNYTFQGWEDVDGRMCLRFQLDLRHDPRRHDLDYERFWVDVERNAHVVKQESYLDGKLTTKNHITLFEIPGKVGQSTWFPAKCHTEWYDGNHSSPFSERTIDVVNGSVRTGVDLPDSLFTVRRDTALPSVAELKSLELSAQSPNLRQTFEAQPPREPFRTDPASVREKIDKNLAEASRQATLLEASSPARDSWQMTSLVQLLLVFVGFATLVGISYWKWTDR